ncbi:7-carboxy-7-deazaguanine synthase QueE [Pyrofollis japonicus]|nr:7-carboxy-7-deazaguanine synthase QueE [Pyrofollis japonicus]
MVAETFLSLQGEGPFTGRRSLFIRLAGCNLRCPFCDTKYSWDVKNAREMTIEELVVLVGRADPTLVVVTGGEPLLQRDALEELVRMLYRLGYPVQVETNGTLEAPEPGTPLSQAFFVVSPKDVPIPVPGAKTHPSWFDLVRRYNNVWFKFVAANKQHVEKIIEYVENNGIPRKRVYIMPLTSEGMTIEEILKLHREIAEEALQNRVNFSPRLHLLLGLK